MLALNLRTRAGMPLAAGRPLDARTRLANERMRLDLQRRLMGWVRTAALLVTAGFVLYKVFELQIGRELLPDWLRAWPRMFAIALIGAALVALAFSATEYRRNLRRLQNDTPWRQSTAVRAAIAIFAVGAVALVAAVARL